MFYQCDRCEAWICRDPYYTREAGEIYPRVGSASAEELLTVLTPAESVKGAG